MPLIPPWPLYVNPASTRSSRPPQENLPLPLMNCSSPISDCDPTNNRILTCLCAQSHSWAKFLCSEPPVTLLPYVQHSVNLRLPPPFRMRSPFYSKHDPCVCLLLLPPQAADDATSGERHSGRLWKYSSPSSLLSLSL